MKYAILIETVATVPVEGQPGETVEVTSWELTSEEFEEEPAPAQTLGGRLLELQHNTGRVHAAQALPNEGGVA